jgi:D-alanyl-lipoteichoic acid acyltransferase DltB (MBOAT superfamily)
VPQGRWIFNMAVVWACTGLWHGANWTFIIWGIYFGLILIAEKLFIGRFIEKLPFIKHIYALFLIIIGWVIFRAESIGQIGEIFCAMFGIYGSGGAKIPIAAVLQQSECGVIFFVMLAVAVIASMPVSKRLKEKLTQFKYGALVMDLCAVIVFVICVMELALGSYNPFIYFDF